MPTFIWKKKIVFFLDRLSVFEIIKRNRPSLCSALKIWSLQFLILFSIYGKIKQKLIQFLWVYSSLCPNQSGKEWHLWCLRTCCVKAGQGLAQSNLEPSRLPFCSWPSPAGARLHGLVDMVGSDYFPALDFLLHRRWGKHLEPLEMRLCVFCCLHLKSVSLTPEMFAPAKASNLSWFMLGRLVRMRFAMFRIYYPLLSPIWIERIYLSMPVEPHSVLFMQNFILFWAFKVKCCLPNL